MKLYLTLGVCGIFAALLISGFVYQSFAADLSATLIPDRDRSEASYVGVKTVTLDYPAGSAVAQKLDGKNERFEFTLNGTAAGQNGTAAGQNGTAAGQNGTDMSEVIAAINGALVQAQSPVQASDVNVKYTGVLRGGPTSAVISYKVELVPTLESYVLQRGEGGQSGHVVDLEWRGITITQPLIVNTSDFGEININYPIGLFQVLDPTLAQQLENTQAKDVLDDPILNFADFKTPMSSWHRLFDPVGTYGASVNMSGTEGAKAVSVYSLGESSLREGSHAAEEKEATASIEGVDVKVHSTTPPPSGQIQIVGYANQQESNGTWFATVTSEAPEGAQTSSGGFPIQVLLVLGGMMGAIAIFILFKARK